MTFLSKSCFQKPYNLACAEVKTFEHRAMINFFCDKFNNSRKKMPFYVKRRRMEKLFFDPDRGAFLSGMAG
jgi:hypothetical protein